MNKEQVKERLRLACPSATILTDEPMSRHTTFRTGGPAAIMIQPTSPQEAVAAIRAAKQCGEEPFVMGNGSNLLVRDGGIDGVVVLLGEAMGAVCREGCLLRAQAGAMLSRLCREALNAGLSGLVFASGIPGTVGGAVAMNAGAYGGQMADVLRRALVFLDGEARWMSREALELGYRTSLPLRRGGVVLEAEFELTPGDAQALSEETAELARRRREKQPLSLPSAGSTFKRPEGHYAGVLIEQAGLKGASVGGAQVSELHAGFIVNTGNATSTDILRLIERVQRTVLDGSGVLLEPEVRIVGRD